MEIHQIWTRCSLIIAMEPFESGFTIGQSVVKHRSRVKVVPRDDDGTTSYVLNSGVTEPNLTKFLHDVQK